jgi:hypothetical protein
MKIFAVGKFGEDHFMTSHKTRGEIDMREEGKESMGLVILRINSSVLFVFVVVLR